MAFSGHRVLIAAPAVAAARRGGPRMWCMSPHAASISLRRRATAGDSSRSWVEKIWCYAASQIPVSARGASARHGQLGVGCGGTRARRSRAIKTLSRTVRRTFSILPGRTGDLGNAASRTLE
jgi:hypothetical protein